MRFILALIAGLWMTLATPLKATTPTDVAVAPVSTELEADAHWNRWVCFARGHSSRWFRGMSFMFRPGSGQGQEAMRVARRMAIRNCQFHTRGFCFSRASMCQVQRH